MTLDEIKSLHWSQLKKMVEEAGGQYENKEKSIQFLIDAGAVTGGEETANQGDESTDADKAPEDLPTLKVTDDAPAAKPKAKTSSVFLDKSRPFGEIFGEIEGFPTARFSQGEHFFNSQGEKL